MAAPFGVDAEIPFVEGVFVEIMRAFLLRPDPLRGPTDNGGE
jgi:hypothetical protein